MIIVTGIHVVKLIITNSVYNFSVNSFYLQNRILMSKLPNKLSRPIIICALEYQVRNTMFVNCMLGRTYLRFVLNWVKDARITWLECWMYKIVEHFYKRLKTFNIFSIIKKMYSNITSDTIFPPNARDIPLWLGLLRQKNQYDVEHSREINPPPPPRKKIDQVGDYATDIRSFFSSCDIHDFLL